MSATGVRPWVLRPMCPWCQKLESLECLHSAWVSIKPDRTVRRMKILGAMCWCGHKSGLDTRSVNWLLVWGLATDVKSCRSGPASGDLCLSTWEAAGHTWDPGAISWQRSTVHACGHEHQQLERGSRAQRPIHPNVSNWGDWASQGQLLDRTGCLRPGTGGIDIVRTFTYAYIFHKWDFILIT